MGAGASVTTPRVTKAQAQDFCGDDFSLEIWDNIPKDAEGTISKMDFDMKTFRIETEILIPASAITNEVEERIRSAFTACDTDNDGKLSLPELVTIFGEESAKWYQEQMDGFGDCGDMVSLIEWEAYFAYMDLSGKALNALDYVEGNISAAAEAAALAAVPALSGDILERVRSAFKSCDTDGGGKLSMPELVVIFGEESAKWYQEQMDGFADGEDKQVSLVEWEAYFAYMGLSGKALEALEYVEAHISAAAAAKPVTLAEGDMRTRVHAAFHACDTIRDNKLTFTELEGMFGEESAKWYAEQMDGFGDKSETISLSEWEAYFVYMETSGKLEEAVTAIEAYTSAAAQDQA